MAINLHVKYSDKMQEMFYQNSFIKGRLNNEHSFSGVRTVKVTTALTVPMVDYTRSGTNRYGTPTDMQDVVQELTLSQDKGFSLVIDKGDNSDQSFMKSAGKMLNLQLREQAIPTMDKYCFKQLGIKAGKITGNSTALTSANVCDRISTGTAYMDEKSVPADGRILYISPAIYKLLKLSDEFMGVEKIANKALRKGEVGNYDNMTVVKVPSGTLGENINFMIVYKNAATAPIKISDTKIHKDPPGISGHLLEGRQYYDCFVFGAKCDGVYVEVNTASGKGVVLTAPTVSATTGAITGVTSGATSFYTIDGSDPRYSDTAQAGTAPTVENGTVVKAYQYKADAFTSEVTTVKVTTA